MRKWIFIYYECIHVLLPIYPSISGRNRGGRAEQDFMTSPVSLPACGKNSLLTNSPDLGWFSIG